MRVTTFKNIAIFCILFLLGIGMAMALTPEQQALKDAKRQRREQILREQESVIRSEEEQNRIDDAARAQLIESYTAEQRQEAENRINAMRQHSEAFHQENKARNHAIQQHDIEAADRLTRKTQEDASRAMEDTIKMVSGLSERNANSGQSKEASEQPKTVEDPDQTKQESFTIPASKVASNVNLGVQFTPSLGKPKVPDLFSQTKQETPKKPAEELVTTGLSGSVSIGPLSYTAGPNGSKICASGAEQNLCLTQDANGNNNGFEINTIIPVVPGIRAAGDIAVAEGGKYTGCLGANLGGPKLNFGGKVCVVHAPGVNDVYGVYNIKAGRIDLEYKYKSTPPDRDHLEYYPKW